MKVAVIGAGAWGTTFAKLLAERPTHQNEDNGDEWSNIDAVNLWVRPEDEYEGKNLAQIMQDERENKAWLAGITLPPKIQITTNIEEAVSDVGVIVSAVPSGFVRGVAEDIGKYRKENVTVVSLTKGVEERDKRIYRMSQVLQQAIEIPYEQIIALSGPNLAGELAQGLPASTVIAGKNIERVKNLQKLLNCPPVLKVYSAGTDIMGVELGGVLKNAYAIAGGICRYLAEQDAPIIGDSSKSSLQNRCVAEMRRIARDRGAKRSTIDGLSGAGDLDLCFDSKRSRNNQFGYELAKHPRLGRKQTGIVGVIEGVRTVDIFYGTGNHNILNQIHGVLNRSTSVPKAMLDLMYRETQTE